MAQYLDKINSSDDLKCLTEEELESLCSEIREFLIEKVSKTGGHLASNLGVVELTVALHKVFDIPDDKIIWDVGHQSYVHKILTGRKNEFDSLRKYGGISGFPKTKESKADCFNTGHSSTSVSAALGMAHARDLSGEDYNVIAVFGDGAMTGGMMYEALNNSGQAHTKVILILNDNEMSISNNVGGISRYLCRLRTKKGYYHSKDRIESILNKIPGVGKVTMSAMRKMKNKVKHMVLPTTFFDDLGFDYLGPIDGHNIKALINIFEIAKLDPDPVFIHIKTTKGKGYLYAEKNPQKFHGISKFNKATGESESKPVKDYSMAFGEYISELIEKNKKIIAITAAMPGGTGLNGFKEKFPKNFFDVGIAEEHAVTMGAGMAVLGFVPVFPIYSSFLQRAYDQILHDVCLQKLHMVFCIDHAGIVGADGETHHGMYDIGFMSHMPYMSILSPSSFKEFYSMLDYAVNKHFEPISIRYPKGNTEYDTGEFEYGKGKLILSGKDVVFISSGRMLKRAKEVVDLLRKDKISAGLIALPTIIPLDKELLKNNSSALTVVLEDHCSECGIGEIIGNFFAKENIDSYLYTLGFPKEPIIHGSIDEIDKHYGLDRDSIYISVKEKIRCLKK